MNIFKQSLEKIKHQQQMLAMLVFTFVAAIIWIAASLFTSQQKIGIDKNLLKLSKPLTPSINKEVIQRLRKKGVFPASQLQNFPIYMVRKDQSQNDQIVEIGSEPDPSPSPIVRNPSPSPSASLSPSPSASSSSATTSPEDN